MKRFYSVGLIIFFLVSAPVVVFGQWEERGRDLPPEESAGLQYNLESPLSPNIRSLEGLLIEILNVLLILAVPIIVFFFIFAGFNYVTAQGNPEKIKTATRSLTYAIIGGVLILGGVAISEIIESVVDSFRN